MHYSSRFIHPLPLCGPQPLVIRLLFVLGNLTASEDGNRVLLGIASERLQTLLPLLPYYVAMDAQVCVGRRKDCRRGENDERYVELCAGCGSFSCPLLSALFVWWSVAVVVVAPLTCTPRFLVIDSSRWAWWTEGRRRGGHQLARHYTW